MKFAVEFGKTDKHLLEFSFNQLLGTAMIKVDGAVVRKHTRWFSEPLKQVYELDVGQVEVWHVRIQQERKLLFGHRWQVFVHEQLPPGCDADWQDCGTEHQSGKCDMLALYLCNKK